MPCQLREQLVQEYQELLNENKEISRNILAIEEANRSILDSLANYSNSKDFSDPKKCPKLSQEAQISWKIERFDQLPNRKFELFLSYSTESHQIYSVSIENTLATFEISENAIKIFFEFISISPVKICAILGSKEGKSLFFLKKQIGTFDGQSFILLK